MLVSESGAGCVGVGVRCSNCKAEVKAVLRDWDCQTVVACKCGQQYTVRKLNCPIKYAHKIGDKVRLLKGAYEHYLCDILGEWGRRTQEEWEGALSAGDMLVICGYDRDGIVPMYNLHLQDTGLRFPFGVSEDEIEMAAS